MAIPEFTHEKASLNIYHKEPLITSLGPGKRYGLWLQGCKFACLGCIVPNSWPLKRGNNVSINSLVTEMCQSDDIEGVTISGGEPLLQLPNLLLLLEEITRIKPAYTIVLYTGYELDEAIAEFGKKISALVSFIDVVITGRFEQDHLARDNIRGSKNQQIYLISNKITQNDLRDWSQGHEIIVRDNEYFVVGVP